ncbi:hypothetical protein NDU88_005990 [Pleurodeles waltl]|uniref:Uncharacterized protein n=1 Tax=Pleurodeles waltl TaxID=8319 RepID=A0AAV7X059_PLEWA|nr:hypothetical protein NDU88_005990 [Pleurodeles waltl]
MVHACFMWRRYRSLATRPWQREAYKRPNNAAPITRACIACAAIATLPSNALAFQSSKPDIVEHQFNWLIIADSVPCTVLYLSK